ncbi:hypothetical protein [Tahibacter amnicola]|uniref:Delta-60 repeat protein n=1 Tax=Tahibacter amnicola TaxID=2976241 RepID=A0ABY6BQU4_9GAMM|nr:hypothetical protein [Tahibacter amnicola]UXI70137.1 hypothetical protein N4264_11050 [Tahibacter amnicola]
MKYVIASLALFANSQASAAGAIDFSFGATPPFSHFYDQTTDGFGKARYMATQADGKIVFATAGAASIAGKGVLIRLNANGTRDWSFGQNGRVVLSYATGASETTTNAVAVAGDGALVVLSTAKACAPLPALRTCVTLERLGKDGQRGPYTSTIHGEAIAEHGVDLVIEPNGDVVTVGAGDFSPSSDWVVRRWRFNGTTWQALLTSRIDFTASGVSRPDHPTAIARVGTGKLLICGWTLFDAQEDLDFAVAQLKPDLTLDTSFSNDGKLTVAVDLPGSNRMDACESIATDATGRIWVGGTAQGENGYDNSVVAAYTTTGTQVFRKVHPIAGFGSALTELLPTRDGTVLFAGSMFSSTGTAAIVGRFLSNGDIDSTFGGNGLVSFNRTPFVPGALPFDWGSFARWQVSGGRTRVVVAGRQLHFSGDEAWGVFRTEVFP